MKKPPILAVKHYNEPSVFTAHSLLREARRQKSLPRADVPPICVLDPDGDIVHFLRANGQAKVHKNWPCYHTTLYNFSIRGRPMGIIGCAVGAAFAVLVAEELFASGCKLLISVTSAGQITPRGEPPYFILITKALRDEGASYHYLPPEDYSKISPRLLQPLVNALQASALVVHAGATWTTDAPFRETETAIQYAHERGILAVEMEAAALYAFAEAKQAAVVCFAHVTNQMARNSGDFEKGVDNGSRDALQLIATAAMIADNLERMARE